MIIKSLGEKQYCGVRHEEEENMYQKLWLETVRKVELCGKQTKVCMCVHVCICVHACVHPPDAQLHTQGKGKNRRPHNDQILTSPESSMLSFRCILVSCKCLRLGM